MVKPFLAHEAVARVRAQLRRARGSEVDTDTLQAGVIELDRRTRRCTVRDQEIDLTRREFDLLEALLANPGLSAPGTSCSTQYGGRGSVSERPSMFMLLGCGANSEMPATERDEAAITVWQQEAWPGKRTAPDLGAWLASKTNPARA